jgi:mRNA-degrading endonuclease RelE of RelBE toxin-antitoxin system
MRRTVVITVEALDELAAFPARFRKPVIAAIDLLEHQADVTTKHRHAMTGAFVPHWQVEVGAHRVYYVFDRNTVTIKAVRRKANKRTWEVFKP